MWPAAYRKWFFTIMGSMPDILHCTKTLVFITMSCQRVRSFSGSANRTCRTFWYVGDMESMLRTHTTGLSSPTALYTRLVSVRLSVCLSLRYKRTHRDSPGGRLRRDKCTFRPDNKEDLHTGFSSFRLMYAMALCRRPISCLVGVRKCMVAWHSSRTSVFGRRTFPVLRSTCS